MFPRSKTIDIVLEREIDRPIKSVLSFVSVLTRYKPGKICSPSHSNRLKHFERSHRGVSCRHIQLY